MAQGALAALLESAGKGARSSTKMNLMAANSQRSRAQKQRINVSKKTVEAGAGVRKDKTPIDYYKTNSRTKGDSSRRRGQERESHSRCADMSELHAKKTRETDETTTLTAHYNYSVMDHRENNNKSFAGFSKDRPSSGS